MVNRVDICFTCINMMHVLFRDNRAIMSHHQSVDFYRFVSNTCSSKSLSTVMKQNFVKQKSISNSSFKGSIFGTLLSESLFFKRSSDLSWHFLG